MTGLRQSGTGFLLPDGVIAIERRAKNPVSWLLMRKSHSQRVLKVEIPSHSKVGRYLSIWKQALVLCRTLPNLHKTLQIGAWSRQKWVQQGISPKHSRTATYPHTAKFRCCGAPSTLPNPNCHRTHSLYRLVTS